MPILNASSGTIFILQILTSAFLAILFLQSGIDKVIDRRGNLEFLQGHFAKSPLAGMVPVLVAVITILEIAAGALSGIGCVIIILTRDPTMAFYGALISAISIVALFFGQRMAKVFPDYPHRHLFARPLRAAAFIYWGMTADRRGLLQGNSESFRERVAGCRSKIHGTRRACPTIEIYFGINLCYPCDPRLN
jgi:hypothetical protein